MANDIDPAAMAEVLSLDPEDRYWYAVARIAAAGRMWVISGEEGVLMPLSPEGFEYLPVWPHRALAQAMADLNHSGAMAAEMTLDEFRAGWLHDLADAGLRIGICPGADGAFWDCGAEEFDTTLEEERSQV
ncbi:DUF2750 domain-containing protein [Oceaniglobus roseus]|uniref:DUF2750 domain-containing protein n=1 Tax=Oceaniglobus roseus TaxID=1737570 RepID=UPI000C7F3D6B|nr:DUF2750 domain-containing protein [Kandeliimicrobium roseum]